MMRQLFFTLVLALPAASQFLPIPAPCFTIDGPCSSEASSVATKAQLALSHIQHLLVAAKATALVADSIIQAKRQGGISASTIAMDINALNAIVQYGSSLAQSGGQIDARFRQVYPGYTGYPGTPGTLPGGRRTFAEEYAQWSRTAMDGLTGTMLGIGLARSHQQGVIGVISSLQGLLQFAEGRMAAAQITAAMSRATAESVERLHSTFLADSASKQAFMAYQIQREAALLDIEQRYFSAAPIPRDNEGR